MATELCKAIESLGRQNRGIKGRLNSTGGEYYADLRRPKMPSTILEIDFHTNRESTYFLTHNHKKIGYAIANAIAKAEDLYMYRAVVESEYLNVRVAPGKYSPIAQTYTPNPLPRGKAVYVFEEKKDKYGNVWCRIHRNQRWVAKKHLSAK